MRTPLSTLLPIVLLVLAVLLPGPSPAQQTQQAQQTITGTAAFADYTAQKPGVRRKITVADLPEPNAAEAVDNGPKLVPRPEGAWPLVPSGFTVQLYAGGDAAPMQRAENKQETHSPTSGTFVMPRIIRTAPNGDLFVADSQAGSVLVLRGITAAGKAATISTYATSLDHPFGIAFYPTGAHPQWVYVANTTTVVRFPYRSGDLKASKAAPEMVVPDLPGYAQLRGGGHWTRDIVFAADGKHMFISVGSGSNADDPDTHPQEFHRADVLEYTADGKFVKVYAYGLRNCVGEAINPTTGQLWCSTNERDNLGNNLVPDYVTSVQEGGFYGWPWFYMGGHQDPRLMGTHPELRSKVITPDVLVQPHMASLGMTFYPTRKALGAEYPSKSPFPAEFQGDGFAAEHGSWNRARRGGYEVIRIPMKNGKATGEYEDFLTGFVTADGQVWGRPVGVTVGHDGALYVTDDGSRSVWRVSYIRAKTSTAAK